MSHGRTHQLSEVARQVERLFLQRRRRSCTAVTGAAASKLLPGSGSDCGLRSRSGRNEAGPAACQPDTAKENGFVGHDVRHGPECDVSSDAVAKVSVADRLRQLNDTLSSLVEPARRPANLLDPWLPKFNALRRRYRSSHKHLIRASHTYTNHPILAFAFPPRRTTPSQRFNRP